MKIDSSSYANCKGPKVKRSSLLANRPWYGMAPYNFIPYKVGAFVSPKEGEERKWSGDIVCELKALTPLLVSGKQGKSESSASDCSFLEVNGKKIIPGTSIKGMLRSLVEILSFSGLRPMNHKKLFWRRVDGDDYRNKFPPNPTGGFMVKRGAEYYIKQVKITPVPADSPKSGTVSRVKTGRIKVHGVLSKDYFFDAPQGEKEIPVDREVVQLFWDQLTPDQERRWSKKTRDILMSQDKDQIAKLEDKEMRTYHGLPVFYIKEGDKIAALGFCRYFRLKYEYSPYELAWPDEEKRDFIDIARKIFGYAGTTSVAGRVAIDPFEIKGKPHGPKEGITAVLGTPKPTCIPFYLEQDLGKIKVIQNETKNNKALMANYNQPGSRLRGHKIYWHHEADSDLFPKGNANEKTTSRLHPLAKGAVGEFVIHIDHLTDSELGGLFEAMELKPGCAHKLGLGRSLGFGSVQITIKAANVTEGRKQYLSLEDRLKPGQSATMDEAERERLRAIFRDHIYQNIKSHWQPARDYYSLEPIANLYRMLDFTKKPEPDAVATMDLKDFGKNPLLPTPPQVLENKF